jgi:hypothetical protein
VRRWDLVSFFSLFFWLTNVNETYSASLRSGESWGTSFLYRSRNIIPPKSIVLVRPGVGVVVHSHDRIAKKNPVIAMSVTTAAGES